MTQIIIEDHIYPFKDLADLDWDSLSPYAQTTLDFCLRWQNGMNRFSLYTSGSTGQPKEIHLSREQMIVSATATGQALGLQAGDQALVCLSVAYIAGLMMLVRGLTLDLPMTVIEPKSQPLAQFSAQNHFDFTAMVPLQLQASLNGSTLERRHLDRMKAILVGGAPLSAALEAQIQRLSAPVYHTYGMTETLTHIALKRLNGPQASECFQPLPGVQLGQDERGCLSITAPVTLGKTLVTNDLVSLHKDGSFTWLGRLDNVINSGGIKIQLEQVETALARILYQLDADELGQRRFFVGAIADARLGQKLVAVVEGTPIAPNTEAEIRENLADMLGKYKVPRQFYCFPKLKETPTGKIDRLKNLARL